MRSPSRSTRGAVALGLLLVVLLYGAPLVRNLNGLDMENDEAGYSYQVDRILETGEWMTPRSVPLDRDFVEKPPLMFWIVAGAMKAGLVPRTDFGLRIFSASFGALAFVYVYLIGCRLHGPLAGLAAGLVLFTCGLLLYGHGLRTNNMEGPLFLAYCAGMFHFISWVEADAREGRRGHAYAAAAAFVLGFMTKFVAAIFLPMLWVLAIAVRPDGRTMIRERWREGMGPSVVAALCILPWFVYQTARMGVGFWRVIVGEHVYDRFAGALDLGHQQPWSHYFTQTAVELSASGSAWVVLGGLAFLAWRAWAARDWLARLLLAWAVVPVALISLGSAKIIYYADPFLPPLALGAGWIAADALGRAYAFTMGAARGTAGPRSTVRRLAGIAGFVAAGIAAWTWCFGPIRVGVPEVAVFRNASILRPAVVALLLFWLGGRPLAAPLFAAAAFVILAALPVRAYGPSVLRASTVYHPLQAVRDCVRDLARTDARFRTGTYVGSGPIPTHAYFFYLRTLGPFFFREDGLSDSVRKQLFDPGRQSLVVLSDRDYWTWGDRLSAGLVPEQVPGPLPPAARVENGFLMVLPGVYGACLDPMLAAGGVPVPPTRDK
jgi:4-amino-4-deoxy-L-arabinose transferase-like glycosyltransferase